MLTDLIIPNTYPTYPPYHVGKYIEEYYAEYALNNPAKTNRQFLDVSWTNHYMISGGRERIQQEINKLDFDKKYYLVCQGDDTPCHTNLPKNTRVYSAGGIYKSSNLVKIPLICSSLNLDPVSLQDKKILSSFIGSDTHEYRKILINESQKDNRIFGIIKPWSIIVPENQFQIYKNVSLRSKFVFCPRGNAPASFRLYEAMQFSAIPIYFSDEYYLPYENKIDWNKLCIFSNPQNLKNTLNYIQNMTDNEYIDRVKYIHETYKNYFTLEATCKKINEDLNNELYNN